MKILKLTGIVMFCFLTGCLQVPTADLSYNYFTDIYYYQYEAGIMIAYKSLESSLSIVDHSLYMANDPAGDVYLISLHGRPATSSASTGQGIVTHRLPNGYLGYYVEISGLNEREYNVYYYDKMTENKYPLEVR